MAEAVTTICSAAPPVPVEMEVSKLSPKLGLPIVEAATPEPLAVKAEAPVVKAAPATPEPVVVEAEVPVVVAAPVVEAATPEPVVVELEVPVVVAAPVVGPAVSIWVSINSVNSVDSSHSTCSANL